MNDDFLHRLREAPPPEFLAQLKARLDRQPLPAAPKPSGDRRGFSFARGLIAGLLLGGAAVAIAAATFNGVPESLRALVRAPAQFLARILPTSHNSDPTSAPDHHGAVPLGPAWFPTHPGSPSGADSDTASATFTPKASAPPATATTRAQDGQQTPSLAPGHELYTLAASPTTLAMAQLVAGRFRHLFAQLGVELTVNPIERLCRSQPFGAPEVIEVSRRITAQELRYCANNGLRDIIEVKLGYQAIVLARAKLYGPLKLPRRDLFLALARQLPDASHPEHLVNNLNITWDQLDPGLAYDRIQLIGPSLDTPPGRLGVELLMDAGCSAYPRLAALIETDPPRYEELCRSMREDGAYQTSAFAGAAAGGPASSLYTDQLLTNPTAIGILSFEQFEEMKDRLIAVPIEGVEPTPASIANGTYPLSRTLYIYAIKRRVQFTRAFGDVVRYAMILRDLRGSSNTWGSLPLDANERATILANADAFKELPQ